ncbi:thiol-disulfide isomerase-like thioredoxin [Herbaspirillum sp. CF444]|uniref:TlpA family protein disulfide reductase n=1 Tax=Herbaspirillum sp. CF444 TaxID=1144319 RepID=UPI0002724C65|nr:TlpA disulfide reductase family protein [Herbaspirillum sp. CF444]EJL83388.1 thiol-disulfide isomerase-like thioredoxin [Herbaspirillum sp. CF444]
MKTRNILLFILVAAIAAGVGMYTSHKQTQTVPQTPEAKAVANLFAQTMPDVAGKPQALSQWKGKPLIINFWATWCAPCVEEMPELAALQAEVAPVQILGIGVDSQENIAQFAEKFHIYYPLYVAGTGATDLLRQFGNQAGGLPFTVLVGLDGNLKKVYLGRLNFDELRRDLASLKNM